MTVVNHPHRRRILRDVSRAGTVACGLMLALSVWTVAVGGSTPVSAVTAGTATLAPTTGGADTEFAVTLPDGAACTGDSASLNYRVQSYMVPGTVAPSSLTFDATGPLVAAEGFRTPLLRSSNGDPLVNGSTSVSAGGGPGLVTGLPTFDFSLFLPGEIPTGTYNVGIACTLGNPGPAQLDRFWNLRLVVDAEAGMTWTLDTDPGTTSTTIDPGTTSTTVDPGTTSTTVDGSTTTTAGGSTTTAGGSSTTFGPGGGSPSAASPVSALGQLPYTGNSPWHLVVWAALLLVFGRMAILFARTPKVR